VTLKITARDAVGKPLSAGGVSWRVALTGPLDLAEGERRTQLAHVTDNLDGTYTATFVPVRPGQFALDVRPQGVSTTDAAFAVPLGAAATITVAPQPNGAAQFDIATSLVQGAGVSRAIEGRRSTFRIIAKDKFAVQMPAGGLQFEGLVQAKDGGSSVTIAFVDNNDGTYTGTYQLAVGSAALPAGWAITVLLDGQQIVSGDVRVLEAGTGAVSVTQSQALGPALANAVAGRTQSILVLVNDVSGLPYVGGGVRVTAEALLVGEPPVVVNGTDRGDGSYEILYRVEKAGQYQLTVKIDGVPVPRSPFQAPGFGRHHALSRAPFKMRAELNAAMATMTEVERMVLMAREFGVDGAPELAALVGAEVRFVLRGLAADGAEVALGKVAVEMRSAAHRVPATVEALADGSVAVVFTPRAPGRYAAHATVGGAVLPTRLVVVVRRLPGESEFDVGGSFAFGHVERAVVGQPLAIGVATVDRAGLPLEKGGERFVAHVVPRVERADSPLGQPFSVPLRDNADGTYTLALAPHVAVPHTVTIVHVATQRVVARTPFVIAVTSDGASSPCRTFSPKQSIVSGPGLKGAVAGRTARFVVHTRDRSGKGLPFGGLRFAVKVAGPVTVESRVTDNGDGSYTVEYQTPRAGQYVVSVRTPDVAHTAIGARDSYSVRVLPWLEPQATLLVGAERPLLPQSIVTLTLAMRDADEKPLEATGLWLGARLVAADGAASVAHVIDNGDGTYGLRLRVPATAGAAQLEVTVAGAPLKHEPFAVQIADVVNSEAVEAAYEYSVLTERHSTEPLSVVRVVEGVATRLAVRVRDAAKQPLAIGGDALRAAVVAKNLPGTTELRSVPVPVVDLGDGSYGVDVVVSNFIADTVAWSVRVERVATGAVVVERAIERIADAGVLFRAAPSAAASATASESAVASAAASYAYGSLVRAPVAIGAPLDVAVQLVAADGSPAPVRGEQRVELLLRGAPSTGYVNQLVLLRAGANGVLVATDEAAKVTLPVGLYVAQLSVDGVAARSSRADGAQRLDGDDARAPTGARCRLAAPTTARSSGRRSASARSTPSRTRRASSSSSRATATARRSRRPASTSATARRWRRSRWRCSARAASRSSRRRCSR
jgi:hypothetical protein